MLFKERLKELIDEKCDGKQIVLARGTGLAHSVISSYFVRGSIPSADQLVKIANFFGCSVDYLLGREDDFGVVAGNASNAPALTQEETQLLKDFRLLDDISKYKVIGYCHALI